MSLLPPRTPRAERAGLLRYQLLTALGGALAYARQNDAIPVLVIHEFETGETDPDLRRTNQRDLDRFAIAHLTKPEIETLSTIFGGFAFGWVAYRTKSFVWPFLIHWFIGTFIIIVASGAI